MKQEGWVGMVNALNCFDHRRGYQFSTYATYAIRQKIQRYLEQSTELVHIPEHRLKVYQLLLKLESEYTRRRGDPPETDQDLADFLDCNVDYIRFVRETCGHSPIYSMDHKEDDKQSLGESIPAPHTVEPLSVLLDKELDGHTSRQELMKAIECLRPKQRQALVLYAEGRTLQEVGEIMNLSRERIRQLINGAILTLRSYFDVDPTLPISMPKERKSTQEEVVDPVLDEIKELFKRKLDEMKVNDPTPDRTRHTRRSSATTAAPTMLPAGATAVPVSVNEFETAVVAYYLNDQGCNTPLEGHPLVAKWGIVRRRLLANLSRLDNERVLIGLGVGTGRYRKGSCQTVVCRKPEGTTSEEVDILPQVFKGLRIKYGQPYDLSRYVANLQERDTAPRPPGPEPPPPEPPKPSNDPPVVSLPPSHLRTLLALLYPLPAGKTRKVNVTDAMTQAGLKINGVQAMVNTLTDRNLLKRPARGVYGWSEQTVVRLTSGKECTETFEILPKLLPGVTVTVGQQYDLRELLGKQREETKPAPAAPAPPLPPPAEPKPAPAITAAPVPASPSNKLALPELRPNDADSIESAIAIRQEHLLKLNAYEAKLRELLASTRTCRRETQGEIAHLEAAQRILTQPLKRPSL